ncbi:MAG: hypothetical protein Q9167_002505 [Letrouitia subvulpina]
MNTIPWLARFGREVTVSIKHLSFLRIAIALPLLQDATFICSLAWIFYRIWQIYQKPVDELVDLLGLDIPPVPEVSLAGITSDSVLLYWKPSEQYSTSLKYAIQVNGIKVGEFGRSDTSIQVTGLKAGNYYNIRVIATNAASFSTLGPLIRLRTSSYQNQDDNKETSITGADKEENESEAAAIRATPSHFDPSSITISQQAIKEWPSSQQSNRRNTSGRRSSPATSAIDPFHAQPTRTSSLDEDESEEAIQRLTEKLDSLRYEQQDLDRQIDEDEHDFKASITNLTKDRDCLKQTLKEREEASADLRRHGNQLDKLNRSAQSRRAAKEKVLSQKRSERQKLKDDISRWENEVVEIRKDVENLEAEKLNVVRSKTEEVEQIKEQIAEDLVSIRVIEEEIRVKGVQIKEFEREREKLSSNDDEKEEGSGIRTDISMDQEWEARAQSMHVQLTGLWQVLKRVS